MPWKNVISGIYIITCNVNNKYYIGKSTNCLHRLSQHRIALRENRHHSFHLQRAYNKYGIDNFTFEILEEYPKEYLLSMEKYWINMLNSANRKYGYNISNPIGDGRFTIDNSTREKMSIVRRGKHLSNETKKKLSEMNKGKMPTNINTLQEKGRLYRETERYQEYLTIRQEKIGRKIVVYNIKSKNWKKFNTVINTVKYLNSSPGAIYQSIDNLHRSVKGYLIFSEEKFNPDIIYDKLKRQQNRKESS